MRFVAGKWVVLAACCALVAWGCGKKTSKVETLPEPTKVEKVEQTTTPPFTPSDEDAFDTVGMDAKAREALVTIYFDYDKYELRPEAIQQLERAAQFLSQNARVRVLVEGHADERGTNEYNMALGENRAKAIKQYLVGYGVTDNRMETTTYGRERPAVPNCPDEACHSKNRRCEWKLLAK